MFMDCILYRVAVLINGNFYVICAHCSALNDFLKMSFHIACSGATYNPSQRKMVHCLGEILGKIKIKEVNPYIKSLT